MQTQGWRDNIFNCSNCALKIIKTKRKMQRTVFTIKIKHKVTPVVLDLIKYT